MCSFGGQKDSAYKIIWGNTTKLISLFTANILLNLYILASFNNSSFFFSPSPKCMSTCSFYSWMSFIMQTISAATPDYIPMYMLHNVSVSILPWMSTFKAKRSGKSMNLSSRNPSVEHHVKKSKINHTLYTLCDVRNYYRLRSCDFLFFRFIEIFRCI